MFDLMYDGYLDYDEIRVYFFVSRNLKHAMELFEELYEEDIMAYAAENVTLDVEEDGYEVEGASIGIAFNTETDEVESVTLTAVIKTADEQTEELDPADIDLDEAIIRELLSKVDEE